MHLIPVIALEKKKKKIKEHTVFMTWNMNFLPDASELRENRDWTEQDLLSCPPALPPPFWPPPLLQVWPWAPLLGPLGGKPWGTGTYGPLPASSDLVHVSRDFFWCGGREHDSLEKFVSMNGGGGVAEMCVELPEVQLAFRGCWEDFRWPLLELKGNCLGSWDSRWRILDVSFDTVQCLPVFVTSVVEAALAVRLSGGCEWSEQLSSTDDDLLCLAYKASSRSKSSSL